jgi:glycosyltransferase involved in cell wall biosynthesis
MKKSETNMAKKLRVLFSGREHRMRRRETMLYPPEGIEFMPLQDIKTMKKDHELTNTTPGLKDKLKSVLNAYKNNNLIAKKQLKNVDLIYSPGHLVLNRFPYVIEIDNVVALTYYNLGLLKILKSFIKKRLRSSYCKAIICISEAAKKSVVNYFHDNKITQKCVVVYPYSNYPKVKKKSSSKIRFLFISSSFYLKGGKEVVAAFNKLHKQRRNINLTLITKQKDIDPSLLKIIKSDKNIRLVEANMNKKELFQKYYSDADVFVLPTYQDSFGLVYLEALSSGLPIIATRTFAVPEMVLDGKNGFLGDSPINLFQRDCTPDRHWWSQDRVAYAKKNSFPEMEAFLEDKMRQCVDNPKMLEKMSEYSKKLYSERFSENKRKKTLLTALKSI